MVSNRVLGGRPLDNRIRCELTVFIHKSPTCDLDLSSRPSSQTYKTNKQTESIPRKKLSYNLQQVFLHKITVWVLYVHTLYSYTNKEGEKNLWNFLSHMTMKLKTRKALSDSLEIFHLNKM